MTRRGADLRPGDVVYCLAPAIHEERKRRPCVVLLGPRLCLGKLCVVLGTLTDADGVDDPALPVLRHERYDRLTKRSVVVVTAPFTRPVDRLSSVFSVADDDLGMIQLLFEHAMTPR